MLEAIQYWAGELRYDRTVRKSSLVLAACAVLVIVVGCVFTLLAAILTLTFLLCLTVAVMSF